MDLDVPMIPAFAGTTLKCKQPDLTGHYECSIFKDLKSEKFPKYEQETSTINKPTSTTLGDKQSMVNLSERLEEIIEEASKKYFTVPPSPKHNFETVFNPINGKPVGIVNKNDGHFFSISQRRYQPTQVHTSKTGKELFKNSEGITGLVERPLIDPSLHHLTEEFIEVSQK